jgi:heme oxygenase (biliverdin-IX-beta and delta-forming)
MRDDEENAPGRPAIAGKADVIRAARTLLRSRRSAVLATALAADGGWPYASLVTIALDTNASPILLLSALSDHTKNLAADPRGSLLFEDASRRANPQTGPRLSVLGRIAADETERLRRRFLTRHPQAAMYADFADFRIFRMTVERAHWVGGFAQARWLQADVVLADATAARAIAEAEPSVLDHMNTDHRDAVDMYATRLLGRRGAGWRMVAVDPDGCDLARGDSVFARLPFPRTVMNADDLRAALVQLANLARESPHEG